MNTIVAGLSLLATPTAQEMPQVTASRAPNVIEVEGQGVAQWRIGMMVTILAQSSHDRSPLPLHDAQVLGVSQTRATLRILGDLPVGDLQGLRVAPRYEVEAALYGPQRRGSKLAATASSSEPPRKSPIVFHKGPQPIPWGDPLWLEMTSPASFEFVEAHVRLGSQGSYTAHRLQKQSIEGHWGGSVPLEQPQSKHLGVDYFLIGRLGDTNTFLVGTPSHPKSVRIKSAPQKPKRAIMQHNPLGRINTKQNLELIIKLNNRYKLPHAHVRRAGDGAFKDFPMKPLGPRVFSVTIPAQYIRLPHIRYYISAKDDEGLRLPGFASAMAPHKVHVTRGKILSDNSHRNRLSLSGDWVVNRPGEDEYIRTTVRYERVFFPFLLARMGFLSIEGMALRQNPQGELQAQELKLTGGEGGIEIRVKDYISLVTDLQAVAYSKGSALGHRVGLRIGDDRGAAIGLSYGAVRDVDDWSFVGETGAAYLSTPLGSRWRLTGRVETDDLYQDAQRSLRLLVDVSGRVWSQLEFNAVGGTTTRDGDRLGAVGRLRLGWSF